VVTTHDAYPRVNSYLFSEYRGSDLKVHLVGVDLNAGTAEMLRAVKSRIRTVREEEERGGSEGGEKRRRE